MFRHELSGLTFFQVRVVRVTLTLIRTLTLTLTVTVTLTLPLPLPLPLTLTRREEDFPYVIRTESLITESCGSSSMASVCSCCLVGG